MGSPEAVHVFAADSADPIPLAVSVRRIVCGARTFDVPVYQAAPRTRCDAAPAVLCLAGGGSSGVLFARLLERAAARGVHALAFDFPGHTPERLLGPATPDRALLRLATPRVRARIVAALLRELAAESPRVQLAAHSAGVLDAAAVSGDLRSRVARFALLGTGLPGLRVMLCAQRAAAVRGLASDVGLREILRTRAVPTGHAEFHFGPRAARAVGDEVLARYQGPEHVAVVMKLFARRSLAPRRWTGARVDLIASAGDLVAPPAAMRDAAHWFTERGARAELHVIEAPLPHMFMMFAAGADRVADLLASAP
jgi:alpha-beta hydrolase superfamily lysophospholipase